MAHIDRARATDAFQRYVSAYDARNPRIALKVDHTLRVAALCERIAASLDLAPEDVDLAWLCGMLHDIGRFEQVRRWGTFSDAASTSHAQLGVEALFETNEEDAGAQALLEGQPDARGEGVIGHFIAERDEDGLLRTAVATHSDFRLPAHLDERTLMFCNIVRDADKVDILKASCTCDHNAIFNVEEGALRASALSPAVVDAFWGHRCVRRDERKHPADLVLGFVCFAFELVYPASVEAAREQGHLLELLDMPFEHPQTAAQVRAMRGHLVAHLDERPRKG